MRLNALQARLEALTAAKAERRAAASALSSVEAGIEVHAKAKNFDKLRETAQASGIATKVRAPPPVISHTHIPVCCTFTRASRTGTHASVTRSMLLTRRCS